MMNAFSDACKNELWKDFDPTTAYPSARPLLAHYTTLPILEKIIMTDEIWLSHPLLMNDSEEMHWGLQEGFKLFTTNEKLREACGSDLRYNKLRDDFSSRYIQYTHLQAAATYVACFCHHDETRDKDGVLSMWRSYGGNGSGVAIIFNTEHLTHSDDTPFVLAPIVYLSREDRKKHIEARLNSLAQLIKTYNPSADDIYLAGAWFMERLKLFALFTKHNGFHEENEWRLAYMPERDEGENFHDMMSYLVTERGAQPKLKLKIGPHPGFKDPELSLAKLAHSILLGPSLSGWANKLGVERMLIVAGKENLRQNVRVSDIPYRA